MLQRLFQSENIELVPKQTQLSENIILLRIEAERDAIVRRFMLWREHSTGNDQDDATGTAMVRHDYVFGHSAEEYERLRRQAQTLEPVTRRLFQAIGLQPGWTCLDLGCGPGETMRLMGEMVGPSGAVTGLDRDPKAGHEAIERLQATGILLQPASARPMAPTSIFQ